MLLNNPLAIWRLVGTRHGQRQVTGVSTKSLPPPSLSGGAVTNPRSAYNPLVLAYLGDAVWEAHTRRLEVEIETIVSQLQQQTWSTARSDESRSQPRPARGRGSGRGARGRGDDRARSRASEGAAAASSHGVCDGGEFGFPSRQQRKQWSTANFQALVFDALMAEGLPPPPHYLAAAVSSHIGPTSPAPQLQPPPASPLPPPPQPSLTQSRPTTPVPSKEEELPGSPPQAAAPGGGPAEAVDSGAAAATAPAAAAACPLVLTAEEMEVLRWGRNAGVSSVPRNVSVGLYKKATAVEVLVAHMYLTAPQRCAQLIAAAVAAPLLARQLQDQQQDQQEEGPSGSEA
ncbi:hypothetical protein Agub_g7238 [Astrephomene gubernaculifera]|uniref:RNase III domain-containing protein n=1 Tax=Astrephomene gubernaculifera TaxID=47775 RepID=A0AAD3HLJ3_9CHLO|nr:hypothetical protein Agub_g7238 [Astrephomene gubernaculifera]